MGLNMRVSQQLHIRIPGILRGRGGSGLRQTTVEDVYSLLCAVFGEKIRDR